MKLHHVLKTCFVMVLIVAAIGCRRGGLDLPTADVAGKVTYQGKPLPAGRIAFVHASGHAAGAEIASDGTFTVTAFQGPNKIAIEYFDYDVPGSKIKRSPMLDANKSMIPNRYKSYGLSGLTFDVKPKDNRAEFELVD